MEESAGRKRRSRFSDAPESDERPAKISSADKERAQDVVAGGSAAPVKRVLDPAAIARAAAAKIAQAIPRGAVPAASSMLPVDANDPQRIAEEQRRRADQIYKSVQEQMSHIQAMIKKPKPSDTAPTTTSAATATATAAAAALAMAAASSSSFKPAPLLLDDQGRQIDEQGNVVASIVPAPVVTLRTNKAAAAPSTSKTNQNPYLSHRAVDKDDRLDTVDPRLKMKKRETRAAKSFSFVEQGTYVKQADQLRARDAKKMMAGFTSGRNPRAYQKESIVPIDEETDAASDKVMGSAESEQMELFDVDVPLKPTRATPDVEWWDIEYLPKEKKILLDKFGFIKARAEKENPDGAAVEYADMKAKHCGTIHVIEHPARINPMFKQDTEPVAVPLMLTAVERKKIRRQNRAEREKEKQDKIALGLMPPPEPKVKLSNMMKVLGEQAVADPSAIERKVRQQMAQREKNHDMRNLARKLTPEERREKKLRKIKEDAEGDIYVAVFRVPDLTNPQHRFKVDVNAQQYHLTGGVLICKEEDINVVVVEGGRKAVKHYSRLLMKRIRWTGDNDDEDSDADETRANDDDNATGFISSSGCQLVWQGIVAKRAFNNFRFQECRTKITARKVMEAKNVVQYWDLVEKSTAP